jgi:hypothetical protein
MRVSAIPHFPDVVSAQASQAYSQRGRRVQAIFIEPGGTLVPPGSLYSEGIWPPFDRTHMSLTGDEWSPAWDLSGLVQDHDRPGDGRLAPLVGVGAGLGVQGPPR